MKHLKLKSMMPPALALLLGLSCTGSLAAALPKNDYACQVQVAGGAMGLVLIQADTEKDAKQRALGAEAKTSFTMSGRATAVVECIEYRNKRFKDSEFQDFFESLPG